MDESMRTGSIIKQGIAKNNKTARNSKALYDACSFEIIRQSYTQPLRTKLSLQYFKNACFLMRQL